MQCVCRLGYPGGHRRNGRGLACANKQHARINGRMATARPFVAPLPYRVGEDGVAEWSQRHADAWIGLLETHKQLTRVLDAELESRYGLSLSALELLARLGAAPDRCLRLSALAAQAGLSLSRVSRIAVTLETRGLIERTPCHDDARAVEAHLT